MTAATALLSAQTARDIQDALVQLRVARTMGDEKRERYSERRLNWLLENRVIRPCSR